MASEIEFAQMTQNDQVGSRLRERSRSAVLEIALEPDDLVIAWERNTQKRVVLFLHRSTKLHQHQLGICLQQNYRRASVFAPNGAEKI